MSEAHPKLRALPKSKKPVPIRSAHRPDETFISLATCNAEEEKVFLAVIHSCLQSIGKTHGVNQIRSQNAFFAATFRSTLEAASLYVQEYRKLKAEAASEAS